MLLGAEALRFPGIGVGRPWPEGSRGPDPTHRPLSCGSTAKTGFCIFKQLEKNPKEA